METNRETQKILLLEIAEKFSTTTLICVPVYLGTTTKLTWRKGGEDTVWHLTYIDRYTNEPQSQFNGYIGRSNSGVTYTRNYFADGV